jgi:hypothetical protein
MAFKTISASPFNLICPLRDGEIRELCRHVVGNGRSQSADFLRAAPLGDRLFGGVDRAIAERFVDGRSCPSRCPGGTLADEAAAHPLGHVVDGPDKVPGAVPGAVPGIGRRIDDSAATSKRSSKPRFNELGS